MNRIVYLNKKDILTAHKLGMTEFGGDFKGYSESCIEKRVVEPQTNYFGEEQYPGVFKKAALYWYKITISHCFADGNKRAGILSTDFVFKI